jgi:hypothetical protein
MFIYVYISILFIIAILYVKNFRNMLIKLFLLALLFSIAAFIKGLYDFGKIYGNQSGNRYYNTIPEVMIEEEYIKKLNMTDIPVYRSMPPYLKKQHIDDFIANNNDLVENINIQSAQNYVNGVIAESKSNTSGGNHIDVINKISTQPFVITLDNGAILNVVPVVEKISINRNTISGEDVNAGIVRYDLESTISNVKSQIDVNDEIEREIIYKEIDAKVIEKVSEAIDSGLKSASITAVATALSI